MKFKIPFTFSNIERQKNKSKFFSSKLKYKKESKLGNQLKKADTNITREEYLGICLKNFFISFLVLLIVSTTILIILDVKRFYLWGPLVSLLFAGFIFFSQRVYPNVFVSKKQREIESNLLPALQDILIQLNSGIPLFNILTNISNGDYGVLSIEFKKAVKRINSGEPEAEVLNDLGKMNPSVYFRRTLWQISNGMNAGSDMTSVVRDSINALSDEQYIQIQNYGNKLNPLIVLYMLIAVIVPALSITFLTIISSIINIPSNMVTIAFIGLFILDILFQIMFLGLIKSRRPTLM